MPVMITIVINAAYLMSSSFFVQILSKSVPTYIPNLKKMNLNRRRPASVCVRACVSKQVPPQLDFDFVTGSLGFLLQAGGN